MFQIYVAYVAFSFAGLIFARSQGLLPGLEPDLGLVLKVAGCCLVLAAIHLAIFALLDRRKKAAGHVGP